MIQNSTRRERIIYLDVLRVLAIFMVILMHAGDPYLWDAATKTFGPECSFYCALLRPCVPLFIIMSSILLLPIKTDTTTFFKRRFLRVVVPFLLWSIIYVFLPTPSKIVFGGPENAFTDSGMNVIAYNLMMIPISFTGTNVHFWFIYTIIGLYLFMPIISPWIQQASKKALVVFLMVWAVTLFYPYIRQWFPQLHGECDWNEFGMLYYFSGYLGYIVLGYFLHKYNSLSSAKSMLIGMFLFAVGLALTYKGFLLDEQRFLCKLNISGVEDWKLLEHSIGNLTINVVLMTSGLFLFFQKLSIPKFLQPIIIELSVFSYAIFLVHYIFNLWVCHSLASLMNLNPGLEQFIIAVIIFVCSYLIVKLISFIPKSKYLIG
ncbi:MAG: acyltransferase family protein [Carboxylicivirga sp.]|jgi:surface polysaccharide O-acyltransferase-like enzyme|nr:acyltransferase family protein [Carboxylicivirga sp.]